MIQWATVILWITTIAEVLGNLGDFAWPLVGFRMTSKLLSLRAEPATPLLPTHSQPSSTDSSDATLSEEGLMDRCSEALNQILETLDLVSTRGPLDDADQVDEFEKLVNQQESLEELLSDRRDRCPSVGSESLESWDGLVWDVERLGRRVNTFTKRIRRAKMKLTVGCNSLREADQESGSLVTRISCSDLNREKERQEWNHFAAHDKPTSLQDEILASGEPLDTEDRCHPPISSSPNEYELDKNPDQWGECEYAPRPRIKVENDLE
ncbi:hypothetical protein PM082_021199 [Marasmius tenuissimus]|nr:hypothetical protein PM082_021199 [Marasmius tenuissimus]